MSRTETERQRIDAFMEEYIQLQLKHGVFLFTNGETGGYLVFTREEIRNSDVFEEEEFSEVALRESLNVGTDDDDWKDPTT